MAGCCVVTGLDLSKKIVDEAATVECQVEKSPAGTGYTQEWDISGSYTSGDLVQLPNGDVVMCLTGSVDKAEVVLVSKPNV